MVHNRRAVEKKDRDDDLKKGDNAQWENAVKQQKRELRKSIVGIGEASTSTGFLTTVEIH